MKNSIFLFLAVLLTAFEINAQETTIWRGPNQGIYDEAGLLEKWPDAGPQVLFTYENLGVGYAAPALANGKIYVSGMEGSTGYIYCLSNEGTLLWKSSYGQEFDASYPGSRATPVIDGEKLYMLSGMGALACMNSETGRMIWKKNIVDEFGGIVIKWGFNETMVVHDDKLICTPGGTKHNVIALNKENGELVWTSKGKGEKSAYCTPILVDLASRTLLVTHTSDHVLGIDADTGSLLWHFAHTNRWSVHPNTPIHHDGMLFVFSGYGKGGTMLKLSEDGSSVSKVWAGDDMDSRMGAAVLLDGILYGSGDNNRDWQAIDWQTGKVLYKTKEIGNGVIIAANGFLYWYSQRGELALVKPEKSSFDIISETKLTTGSGQHWAHPVIERGVLYIRRGSALNAYKIAQ
jgi:outer membrane protein assembly factor BamB